MGDCPKTSASSRKRSFTQLCFVQDDRFMKKILLIRTDRIGDVVLTTPSIKIVRDHFPQSHIAFMTGPQTRDIVDGNPYLNEIIVYDKKRAHKNIIQNILFSLKLKRKKFDTAIIFNPSNRIHWITYLANIPMRIGYSRKLKFLLTHFLPDKKHEGLKSEALYNEDLLTFLGISSALSRKLYFPIKKESQTKIQDLLKKHNLHESHFVVMTVSASDRSRIWPSQNFAHLIQLLYEKLNLKTVLIGHLKKSQEVCALSKIAAPNFSETLSLAELGILFQKALLHISSDTGPMHIASAVGTPVITIFGRTLPGLGPKRWSVLQGKNTLLHKNIGCNPCLAYLCQLDFDCFKATKVEEVFNAVRQYI
ncbi:MAG TPA: hypothetical protein DD708_02595 [Deltaproteobacteria bacterium]|nr:hypothetical protein [Deltaproteobacteria bacterium]